jgi:aminoglycoside phosphotransferase (APT) family kinase protein
METLEQRVERLAGSRPIGWEPRAAPWQPPGGVPGGNKRFSVVLADNTRVFVKYAEAVQMSGWLRREAQVYEHVRGAFMPRFVGFDDGDAPLLVLEDLTGADWPPPWSGRRADAVLSALADVRRAEPPPDTPTIRGYEAGIAERWARVADDPEPFLSLGLVSRDWLAGALPTLIEASRAAQLDGSELVHLDVRSDNLCFRDGRAILVDWNHACIGNGDFDVAFWLPSLAAEGGPLPDELLPGAGVLTAVVSGYFAAVAGLPPPALSPTVRPLQLAQLKPALAWARRELAL